MIYVYIDLLNSPIIMQGLSDTGFLSVSIGFQIPKKKWKPTQIGMETGWAKISLKPWLWVHFFGVMFKDISSVYLNLFL